MFVTEYIPEKNRKVRIHTDVGHVFTLYRREAEAYGLKEGAEISDSDWRRLRAEILDIRARRRALHLLEQMDRTEYQLRRKLTESGYPEESVEQAVIYVKSYHYIDDLRYAESYIRYHQQQKSRLQLKMSLIRRGISPEKTEKALEEAYEGTEEELIRRFLVKKNYDAKRMDQKEKYKIYQFLMRKGFSGSVVRRCMDL